MAVGDAHVFPGFLTPVLMQLFFPKPPTNFLTCFCRGERRKYAERKVTSTRDRTHNYHVMSPTRSPKSHLGGAQLVDWEEKILKGFYFGCHGNQNSSWNTIVWRNLKEDNLRNIPVKFGKNPVKSFWGEDFCMQSFTDTCTNELTDGRTMDTTPWQ